MTVSPQEAYVDEQRRMSWEPLRIRSEEFPNLATAKDFDMANIDDHHNLGKVPPAVIDEPDEMPYEDQPEDTQAHMPDAHTRYKLPEISRELAKASVNLREASEAMARASAKANDANQTLAQAEDDMTETQRVVRAWMKQMEDFT